MPRKPNPPVPDPDPPISGFECAKCGTGYDTLKEAVACPCRGRGQA